MNKRQQMRWSRRGADLLIQVRCAVYNGTLGSEFGQRFHAANDSIPANRPRRLTPSFAVVQVMFRRDDEAPCRACHKLINIHDPGVIVPKKAETLHSP
jgi:hypothetical protein